jgi:hypothetical protein
MDDGAEISCPYCASSFWMAVDSGGAATQRFISDCEICCRPIVFHARRMDDGAIQVDAATEEESP